MSNRQNIVFSKYASAFNSNNHNDNNSISLDEQSNDSELNKKPFNKFERFYNDPANQRSKIREEIMVKLVFMLDPSPSPGKPGKPGLLFFLL